MTEQAARFVGSIPEHYDRHLGPRIFADFAADMAHRATAHGPGSVLELAAGTGIASRHLRDRLPAVCQLMVTDLNPPMLAWAEQKFAADEIVQFQAADATRLPFADNSFDLVVCQFGVMFFPDKAQSYREVSRVLRPGGRYLFNVWGAWQHNPFAQIAHEAVSDFFPDNPPGFYRVPFGYSDTDVIKASLLAAGFDTPQIAALDVTADIPSAADFATGLVFGNPLIDEIQDRGGDPQAVCVAIAAALDEKLGTAMPLHAIVVDAQKS